MIKKYTCYVCDREQEFETESTPQLLMEAKQGLNKSVTFVVACRKCGEQNQVEVAEDDL